MSEPNPTPKRASALPYALLVPVLVVMAQSGWVVITGGSFRLNALLPRVFDSMVLAGMTTVALISFCVIRPFANRPIGRWIAFLGCVLGFTVLIELLSAKVVE